jgi:hypothetical protein
LIGPSRIIGVTMPPPDHAKKSVHAAEQDRPDVLARHWDWFESQPDLDADRLAFIDEKWASTNAVRGYGRAPRASVYVQPFRTGIGKPPPSSPACATAA